MPSVNYKKRFVPDVESGIKKQTIRKKRKNPIKPGDKLYFFTGLRTKHCRRLETKYDMIPVFRTFFDGQVPSPKQRKKLIPFVRCKSVDELIIYGNYEITLNRNYMKLYEIEELAKADGFNDSASFFKFFIDEYKIGKKIKGKLKTSEIFHLIKW